MTTRERFAWHRPVVSAFAALVLVVPFYSQAATCTFTKDLDIGVIAEEVRCLQQYLNASGFTVSETGAGSPGKETDEYKLLTKAAVIRWQEANRITPASGYFGPKSRAVYQSLVSGGTTSPAPSTSPSTSSGNALVDQLLAQLNSLQTQAKAKEQEQANDGAKQTGTVTATGDEKKVRALMLDVLDAMDDAEEAIDDSDDDEGIADAEDSLENGRTRFFIALRAYLSGDTAKALTTFERAMSSVEDAIDEAGGDETKQDVRDLLDELDERRDEVEERIAEADDDGEPTSKAEDLWDEADELIDEAEDLYDEGEYEDALDLAEEAEELLDDAEDAIGDKKGSVEDELDDARDELDDAWDVVDEAIDDGEDVGDAEDLLEEAEDLLDEAEDALDDDDEDEAEDLIDEALDLIEEALDEW